MKRILTFCAVTLAGALVLALPESADACSRCNANRPLCDPAINLRCFAYPEEGACEEYVVSCAYAYAPAEISADGSIARLAASEPVNSSAEQVRGCHGLIVDRAYSGARQARIRAGSRHIAL